MDGITFILIGLLAGSIMAYLLFQYLNQRRIDDQRAAFWANVKEPLCYRSQDIDDDGVLLRVENARKKLKEHGNVFLNPATDVHFWVYRSDATDASADFEAWRDIRDQQAIEIRQRFRELKSAQMAASGNPFGAATTFGQQQRPTQN